LTDPAGSFPVATAFFAEGIEACVPKKPLTGILAWQRHLRGLTHSNYQ
jgi:hypothetical protein